MQATRILIADDDERFRQHIKEFLSLERGIEVVGEAADGHEAILKARALKPDLILMDVSMSGMNGISATRQIADEMPSVSVIMLSLYDLQAYKDAAAKCGAVGYVVKRTLLDELVPAIRSAVSPRVLAGANE